MVSLLDEGSESSLVLRFTRHIITLALSLQSSPRPPSLFLLLSLTLAHPVSPGFFSRSSLHPSISWSVATLRYFDSRGLQPPSLPHRRQYGRPLHTGYITAALLNYARYFFEGESRVLPSLTLPPFFSFLLIYPPRLFLFFPLENSSLSFFTL